MEEKEEIIDRILKTSICFRIDIEKAETLITELTELEHFLGPDYLEEMYPTLYPLKDWLGVLLNDFYAEHKDEYLKLKTEREDLEARISELIASKMDDVNHLSKDKC